VADGACRLADGTLAGSILTMDQALRNFMAATGLSVAEAWPATSRTALRALNLAGAARPIGTGCCADLVFLDEHLTVFATIVNGNVIYPSP
jgi:N-acetylglucosamine-6-phosphate deacetylase